MERPDELRALGRLAVAEFSGATGGIGGIHGSIAVRVFGTLGAQAEPVRRTHDAIAQGVYASVGGAAALAGVAADRLLALRDPGDGRQISSGTRGAAALGVLGGLYGDALERDGSDLQEPMSVRAGGRVVALEADAVAAAFPAATPRLAVFVHGLMETEHAWRIGDEEPYGPRLARELGITPVEIRFNSGRHISENGRSLDELLAHLTAAWPREVGQIALIGHSMGGLIARSACHRAASEGRPWVGHVRHVVSLGSPHLGAPLAQGVHVAAHALHSLPETRPLANLLRRRSAGIRDLRHGSLVDADWQGGDPDALRAAACAEVPLLEGATHYFVAATVTRDPRHPVGRLVGDALVLGASASGRGRTRTIAFRDEDGLELGGAHHLALLNHPAVYARLREWLATPARGQAGSQAVRWPSRRHSTGKNASSSSDSPGRR